MFEFGRFRNIIYRRRQTTKFRKQGIFGTETKKPAQCGVTMFKNNKNGKIPSAEAPWFRERKHCRREALNIEISEN